MTLPIPKWIPSPNFNSRRGTRVDQIIIHRQEGTQRGSVAYFQTTESQVSAHFCINEDGTEIVQMVHLADRAWHACAANSRSVGIEPAGYGKDGFPAPLLQTTAELTAWLCHHLQIPVRHARGGVGPGIESHFGLGVAGGHHFDPVPDENWIPTVFLPLVQAAYDKGDYDPMWDRPENGDKVCPLSPPAASTPSAKPLDLATVSGVQQALNALGAHVSVDGDYGAETAAAVKAFQAKAGITADGLAGPLTKAAILKALSGG